MAAPVATVRGTPAGIKLKDGFSSLVTFAINPTIGFWEKTVTPPGIDGGDSVDQVTMHNLVWRTMAPRQLKTLTEFSMMVAYDPAVYTSIVPMINIETTVTVKFPDGSTLAFFGFLRSFEPNEMSEGNQPEATINVTPTNFDPVNHVEAAPVLTSVVGT